MNEEDDKYMEKLHLLSSRCEAIQRENEGIARQVVKTRKHLCKARRLRMRLLKKLDEIGDPWRHGQVKGISLKNQSQTLSSSTSNLKSQSLPVGSSSSSLSNKMSVSSPELECSSGVGSLVGLSNSTLMSDAAAALVSTLTSLPMPMLPLPISPTPSPFADHDLLPSESLANNQMCIQMSTRFYSLAV
ncbi:unnamed protein product [Allacma fusca]|uniref:Uncharacterized protein n=1 Tax=Allacma fusca TaxID=39272 RepID=A0A8J2JH77_9HEXA|nr:unnamed protein product [Allacma fusca]